MRRLKDLRSKHLRAIFSLVISMLLLLQKFDHIGWMHGVFLPDRRRIKGHWVGSQRKRVRPLRPIDLLFPVGFSQLIIFACAAQSPQPVYLVAVGNILLIALAMLPSTFAKSYSIGKGDHNDS